MIPDIVRVALPDFPAITVEADNIGHMNKAGALCSNIDKGRLHTRQYPHHLARVNVADNTATGGALDVDVIRYTIIHNGNTRLHRCDIDQDFLTQRSAPVR